MLDWKRAETPLPIERHMRSWMRTGITPRRADFPEPFREHWWHPDSQDEYARHYCRRRHFIRAFGFAMPCREAIAALKRLSPIIEVCAGTGAWAPEEPETDRARTTERIICCLLRIIFTEPMPW